MTPVPKRHHIVPRTHLRQWSDQTAGGDPLVWVLSKTDLSRSRRHVNDVLVERHYLREIEPSGERHAPLEERLNWTETGFAELLPSVERHQVLTPAQVSALWEFVLTMFTRTAWWRQHLLRAVEQARVEAPRRAVEQLLAGSTHSRAIRRKLSARRKELESLAARATREDLAGQIEALKTKVHPMLITASQNLDAAREFPFMIVRTLGLPVLTSDTPCFFEDPAVLQIERTTDKGHAIVCPLTPHLVFVGAQGLLEDSPEVGPDWVRRLNARIRANARRELVANTGNVDENWFFQDSSWPPTMREEAERAFRVLREPGAAGSS